jgi:uncharacterized protein
MHKIRFEAARLVFDDPFHVSRLEHVVEGEERWQTMGLIGAIVIVLVAHAYGEEENETAIRIISARKATPHERRHYDQNRH